WYFFFSSRRRHTRFSRDWSSDVCSSDLEMRVLRLDEALELERVIRVRGGAAPGTAEAPGPGAGTAPGDAGRELLALGPPELVRLGLVSNRGMVVVAGAFALAWQVLPERTVARAVRELAGELFGYASGFAQGTASQVVAVALLAVLAVAVLRLLSVLLAVLQYHGFRLVQEGRRLTVERGLLTRLRTSAPRRRIQGWSLREGVLHRLLGRRSLHVDTVASVGEGGEHRGLRELAPIAPPDACDALVRELLPGVAWPPAGWHPLARRARVRLALPGILFGVAAAAVGGWASGPTGLLGLLWIPWAAYAARQHAARAGWSLDARLVAVRGGWWTRQWRFAEIDKLQALRLERSPLDRWSGTATLWLDIAGTRPGHALRLRLLPEAQARALHRQLAEALARLPLRW